MQLPQLMLGPSWWEASPGMLLHPNPLTEVDNSSVDCLHLEKSIKGATRWADMVTSCKQFEIEFPLRRHMANHSACKAAQPGRRTLSKHSHKTLLMLINQHLKACCNVTQPCGRKFITSTLTFQSRQRYPTNNLKNVDDSFSTSFLSLSPKS